MTHTQAIDRPTRPHVYMSPVFRNRSRPVTECLITACLTSRLPDVLACVTILRTDRHVALFVEGRAEALRLAAS